MTDRKRLITNFLSLSSVQVVNYILPLITIPYLVRVLGPEKFGLIAFAQAFIGYFGILTDYGFNLSATREISVNRADKEKVSDIFSAVTVIKVALMALSFLLLCLIVFSIHKFRAEWLLYFITFGMVLGGILFPVWIFQGLERMKQMALLNILARLFFTLSIFIFIRSESDYLYVPLINSLGSIVAGIFSLIIVFYTFRIRLKIPSIIAIKYQLREGWHIFISTIAISLYTISNTFILGLFTNNVVVGYYSAGEKIVRAVVGLIGPLTQTVYPHISKLAAESRESALHFIRKLVRLVGIPMFGISLFLLIFAPQISNVVLGSQYKESIPVIQILSFLPFVIGIATVFANFFLLGFGYTRIWSAVILTSSSISIFGAILFVYGLKLQHIGVSINVLITETFVLLLSWVFYKKITYDKFCESVT